MNKLPQRLLLSSLASRCPSLSDSEKVTFQILLDYHFEECEYPTVSEIADLRGRDSSSVFNHLKKLRDLGFLYSEKKGRNSIYLPNIPGFMLAMGIKGRRATSARSGKEETIKAIFEAMMTGLDFIEDLVDEQEEVFVTKTFNCLGDKQPSEFNIKDLGYYYRQRYKEQMKASHSTLQKYQYALLRKLQRSMGSKGLVDLIDFLMDNWKSLDYVSSPLFRSFGAQHEQLLADMKSGKRVRTSTRNNAASFSAVKRRHRGRR